MKSPLPLRYYVFIILGISAVVGLYFFLLTPNLNSPPARTSNLDSTKVSREESILVICAKAPVNTFQNLLESLVPKLYTAGGTQHVTEDTYPARSFLGSGPVVKIGADINYSYTLARGAIGISTANPVTFSMPLHIAGNASANGYLGNIIGGKAFGADCMISTGLNVDVNSNVPQLSVSTSYGWTSQPHVEILQGVWLDMQGPADSAIKAALSSVSDKIKSSISPSAFNQAVGKYWKSYHVPLSVDDQLYVHFVPSEVGLSDLRMDGSNVDMVMSLKGFTSIDTSPTTITQCPAFTLKKIPSADGQLSLNIPVSVDYSMISNSAKKYFASKPIDVPGAKSLVINDVKIYPSNGKLVVGVKIALISALPFLSTRGWLYLWAEPIFDDTTDEFHVDNVGLASEVDNSFWHGLISVAKAQICKEVEKASHYNVQKDLDVATQKLSDSVKSQGTTNGVQLTLGSPKLHLTNFVCGQKLLLNVAFSSHFDTSLDLTKLFQR